MAGIIEQQPCQQLIGFVAHDGAVGLLGEVFLPDWVKQRAIHDRRLLARQDLILVFDLADIEVVTQQIVQRATAERDATARRARREPFCPGPNVAFFEIPNELVDAPEFEISSEDPSDQFSFFFNDGNLSVFHLIAKGQGAKAKIKRSHDTRNCMPGFVDSYHLIYWGGGSWRHCRPAVISFSVACSQDVSIGCYV